MSSRVCSCALLWWVAVSVLGHAPAWADPAQTDGFTRVQFNHPGLTVDLGVGLWAWPLPMDWDHDGDLDLIVSCPDVPFEGTYVFENPGGDAAGTMPVFKPPVRIGKALRNAQISYVDGQPRVLTPATEWEVRDGAFVKAATIHDRDNVHGTRVRANQWRYVDWELDGDLDLVVGVGDWSGYGWDNAFDDDGNWTREPLHGYVYLLTNVGSAEEPVYGKPALVEAAGEPVDVFGMPSPNLADFDGDGDLDLLCGEFLDGFTYFQNEGTRRKPSFAAGRRLTAGNRPLTMDLQMITPTAVDWDGDGDQDLVVGDEDGRVALIEHSGKVVNGLPQFAAPRYFQQEAADLKFGALVTPVSVDWDGDGDEDLVCGNSAGYLGLIENLDGGNPPRWAAPRYLKADGEVIRIQAGRSGSIQGPAEAKWGYTTFDVGDWNHDGKPDIVLNSIWGRIEWLENVGSRDAPELAAPRPVKVAWQGKPPAPAWNWWQPEADELATQWRTTPLIEDWDQDGLQDLIMLDHEGYLAWYRRAEVDGVMQLEPGRRIFHGAAYDNRHRKKESSSPLLRLNVGEAGQSGRRKMCFVDWNQDGRLDLLVNSTNINVMVNHPAQQSAESWHVRFEDAGMVNEQRLAGHTTSPTTVDWDQDGVPDLLVGAEDGRFYFLKNPHQKSNEK